jgi:hypothetical protein
VVFRASTDSSLGSDRGNYGDDEYYREDQDHSSDEELYKFSLFLGKPAKPIKTGTKGGKAPWSDFTRCEGGLAG